MNILGQNNFLIPNSMRGGIHVEPTLGSTKSVVGNMDIWRAAARPELVANGGFDADTGWSKLGGFSIGAGKATCVQTGGNDIIAQQIPSAVDGESYTLRLEYSTASSGAFRVYFGSLSGSSSGGGVLHEETLSGDGVLEITQAWGTETWLMLFSVGTWEGTIDNVSVRLAGATKLSTSAQRIWDDVLRMLGGKPEKWGTLTAVDPSVVPCAELAPELVTNGDFSDGLTDWTIAGTAENVSVSNGVLYITTDGVASPTVRQNISGLTVGKSYIISLNMSGTNPRWTGPVLGWQTAETYAFTATATSFNLTLTSTTASATATFSNISIHLASAQPGEHPLDHTAQLTLFSSALNVGVGNVWRSAIGIDYDGTYGADSITNGGFDSDTSWGKNTNWTISGGKAVANGATDGQAITQAAMSGSGWYRVSYDCVVTSGSCFARIGSLSGGTVRTESGSYAERIYFDGTGKYFNIFGSSDGFTGTIDNVVLEKENRAPVLAPSADAASFVGVGGPAWDARLNGTDQYLKADLTGLTLAHDPGWTDVFVGLFPTVVVGSDRVFNVHADADDYNREDAYSVFRSGTGSAFQINRIVGTDTLAKSLGTPVDFIALSFNNGVFDFVSDSTAGSDTYDDLNDLDVTKATLGVRINSNFGDPLPHARALLTVPLPNAELTNLARILKAAHDAASVL